MMHIANRSTFDRAITIDVASPARESQSARDQRKSSYGTSIRALFALAFYVRSIARARCISTTDRRSIARHTIDISNTHHCSRARVPRGTAIAAAVYRASVMHIANRSTFDRAITIVVASPARESQSREGPAQLIKRHIHPGLFALAFYVRSVARARCISTTGRRSMRDPIDHTSTARE